MCGIEDYKTRLKKYHVVLLNYLHTFALNIFSVSNTLYLHNQHRILASSIYNIGTVRKIVVYDFHPQMLGV